MTARRVRLDLSVRRPGERLLRAGGRAIGASIPSRRRWRAGRRARRAAFSARSRASSGVAGERGDQGAARHRRAARRPAVARRQRLARTCAKCVSSAIRSARCAARRPAIRARRGVAHDEDAPRDAGIPEIEVERPRRCAARSACSWTCASRTKPCSARSRALCAFRRRSSKRGCSSSIAPRDTSSRAASERSRCGRRDACATPGSPGSPHLRGGLLGVRGAPRRVRVLLETRQMRRKRVRGDRRRAGRDRSGHLEHARERRALAEAQRAIRRGDRARNDARRHGRDVRRADASRSCSAKRSAGIRANGCSSRRRCCPSNASYRGTLAAAERSLARLRMRLSRPVPAALAGRASARRDDARARGARGAG